MTKVSGVSSKWQIVEIVEAVQIVKVVKVVPIAAASLSHKKLFYPLYSA